MTTSPKIKPLHWLGRSKSDLLDLPTPVIRVFGYALYLAQAGGMHEQAKPLHGFGSAGVLEIVEDWRGNAYRAVYTVRFEEAVSCFTSSRRNLRAVSKHPSRTWT